MYFFFVKINILIYAFRVVDDASVLRLYNKLFHINTTLQMKLSVSSWFGSIQLTHLIIFVLNFMIEDPYDGKFYELLFESSGIVLKIQIYAGKSAAISLCRRRNKHHCSSRFGSDEWFSK